jgi:hypothetical protein
MGWVRKSTLLLPNAEKSLILGALLTEVSVPGVSRCPHASFAPTDALQNQAKRVFAFTHNDDRVTTFERQIDIHAAPRNSHALLFTLLE